MGVWSVITSIIPAAIAYTMPLLMGALGGLYSERSGVTNLCIEGLMLTGCFASATVTFLMQSAGVDYNLAIVCGIVAAMLAGALLSLLHAFAAINLRGIIRQDIPLLSKIPVIGPLLFTRTYWTTWICLVIWVISFFLLYKTSFGLRLRACGEHPSAVASAGINVHKMRYIGVVLSGLLSGLGGACILATYAGEYNSTSGINGLGFLAIAALIFGQWKPLGILASTFFFGICMTIANMGRVIPVFQGIPTGYLGLFPYVATLIALVLSSKKSAAPIASGEPF